MNRRLVHVVLSLVVVAFLFPLSFATSAADQQAEKLITKIEADWGAALVKNDITAVDRIVAPEWMYTGPEGTLSTKAEVDAEMKAESQKIAAFHIDELKVRVFGDTAVVYGFETEKSTYKGADTSGQYRFTDVFIKREGKWLCVATHVSKVTAPKT